MTNDSRSRKWQITINNPVNKGFTHDEIMKKLSEIKPIVYYCLADEIGEQGTYHTHVFIACSSAVRFSRLLSLFEGGHFEMANGTSQQNRDYVFKQGKWAKDKKAETQVEGTQFEYGEMPVERQGKRNDLDDLYDMINGGMSDADIIEQNPSYMLRLGDIQRTRQLLIEKNVGKKWRDVNVTFICGIGGVGKTRSVYDQYGYDKVYRVTDYEHPFDGYCNQDVIVFDEFTGQIPLTFMNNICDGYPLSLPCRFVNKWACFNKVYIISNLSLEECYFLTVREQPSIWHAFLRRLNRVMLINNYTTFTYTVKEYLKKETQKQIADELDAPF